jgi:hypothetical protein
MPNSKEIVYIRGPIHWTKVLGDPVDNYDKNGREWTFDLALDKAGVKQMNGIKVQGKPVKNIKNRDDERGDFVQFKQKYREPEEYERYGQKVRSIAEQRIKVMDAEGNAWDQDVKIGNGTIADVKFEVVDYGKGKYAGVYPRAIRVLKHVPYAASEFAPMDESDEFYKAPSKGDGFVDSFLGHTASDDLDDDIPE